MPTAQPAPPALTASEPHRTHWPTALPSPRARCQQLQDPGPTGASGVTGPTGLREPPGVAEPHRPLRVCNSACCVRCTEQIKYTSTDYYAISNNNSICHIKIGDAVVGRPGALIPGPNGQTGLTPSDNLPKSHTVFVCLQCDTVQTGKPSIQLIYTYLPNRFRSDKLLPVRINHSLSPYLHCRNAQR